MIMKNIEKLKILEKTLSIDSEHYLNFVAEFNGRIKLAKTDEEKDRCPVCENKLIRLGPIYTGSIYEKDLLEKMRERIKNYHGETQKVFNKIYENDARTDVWYYYDLRFLAKSQKVKQIPKISEILKKYNAFRTHFSNLGVKSKDYIKLSHKM